MGIPLFFGNTQIPYNLCFCGLRAVVIYLSFLGKKKVLNVFVWVVNLVVKWLCCTLTILLWAVVGSNEVKVEVLDTKILWL